MEGPGLGSDVSERTTRFPSGPGPTCFYCKKKGHVMAECRALERKNQKVMKSDMLLVPLVFIVRRRGI